MIMLSYCTRNKDQIALFKVRHDFFKNFRFPYTLIEWNSLDPTNINYEKYNAFKIMIL